MPPFLPRKRVTTPPPASSLPAPSKRAKLADVLDAESRNIPGLGRANTFSLGSDDSDSTLSDVDSEEFEDVPVTAKPPQPAAKKEGDEDEDDEDIEWEDAGANRQTEAPAHVPLADGPIQLVFRKDDTEIDYGTTATTGRKGASKREKEVRIVTHQMHVQFLLWHNSIRNIWISDRAVQRILLDQLPPQIRKEVEKWKRASGLSEPESEANAKSHKNMGREKGRGKGKAANARQQRDWGRPSQRIERGRADMSNGDPIISLMRVLAAYWKKRFAITAPGLRKRGYGTKQALKQLVYSFKNDEHDDKEHGERIRNIDEFRAIARKCEGSRDVGAQLFTALLRGLGIESRLVASLQPSGFGWTKAEQRLARKPVKNIYTDTSSEESDLEDSRSISEITQAAVRGRGRPKTAQKRMGTTGTPIDLDSDLDEAAEDVDANDDESVVDITPSMPKKRHQKYDRDNPFPIYWTEVTSPVTHKVLPVSPFALAHPVASTTEILALFEPRGVKAENTKTVVAYVIAYSSDGSAKDVTIRYLKKRIWPGKTKGFRFPPEKIPVYNKYGKVKRYEDYDWFKRVMSGYERTNLMRTAVDDVEESHDLVPQLPDKKEINEDVDTLQSLKASADFVLERFLRREEALRPGAKPDRTFVSGKGDNLKEEPVYLRSDVERCLTAESWHKEGRRPSAGEAPLKLVPVRAVTVTRKREAEEHERQTGEKQMQGLYSWDQTEYIIPPPIQNGIIPKNAYGNMDCFVPSMVPRGAVHIPLRSTVRICKKLDVDFAEAVTGFEFGNKRAVPVCTGVVVAQENERAVIEAWTTYNEEQKKKQETKMERLLLDLWRKFVMGLRIRERVQDTYGDSASDGLSALPAGTSKTLPISLDDDEDVPDGTLPVSTEEDFGGGFLLDDEESAIPEELEMVHHEEPLEPSQLKGKGRVVAQYPTPLSISPLRPGRQRTSLLRGPGRGSSSELSSMASGYDFDEGIAENEESAGDDEAKSSASEEEKIQVIIPASRRRRPGPTGKEPDTGSDASGGPPSDDGEEDDYMPSKSLTRNSNARNSVKSTPQTRTSSRRSKAISSVKGTRQMDSAEDEIEDDAVTPKSKRSRRRLRRDSTGVTSPYF